MIEILSQSALATVQDLGRFGACAGASAPPARWTGWRSPAATSCSATTTTPPASRSQVFPVRGALRGRRTRFALTGADCAATLDGVPLLPWSSAPGDGRPGAAARAAAGRRAGAARAPTSALAGGVDVPDGARLAQHAAARRHRRPRRPDAAPGRPAARPARPAAAPAIGFGLVPPGARAAARGRRPAGGARAAGRRVRRLHRGLARRASGRSRGRSRRRATATAIRLAGPALRADGADGDALARHRARA